MWKIEKKIKKGDYDYALVRNHPGATKRGYVLMHRVVMENHLGRLLKRGEIVHHIDHNKHNNDISNLELMSKSIHSALHGYEHCRWYAWFICPWCKSTFHRPWNETSSYKFEGSMTFCSHVCRASYERKHQLEGISDLERDLDFQNNLIGLNRERTDSIAPIG